MEKNYEIEIVFGIYPVTIEKSTFLNDEENSNIWKYFILVIVIISNNSACTRR